MAAGTVISCRCLVMYDRVLIRTGVQSVGDKPSLLCEISKLDWHQLRVISRTADAYGSMFLIKNEKNTSTMHIRPVQIYRKDLKSDDFSFAPL